MFKTQTKTRDRLREKFNKKFNANLAESAPPKLNSDSEARIVNTLLAPLWYNTWMAYEEIDKWAKSESHLTTSDSARAVKLANSMKDMLENLELINIKLNTKEINLADAEKQRSLIKLTSPSDIVDSLKFQANLESLSGNVSNIKRSINALSIISSKSNELNDNYDAATSKFNKFFNLSSMSLLAKKVKNLAFEQRFYTEIEKKNFVGAKEILKDTELNKDSYNKLIAKLELQSAPKKAPAPEVTKKIEMDNILSNAILEAEVDNISPPPIESSDKTLTSSFTAASESEKLTEDEVVDPYNFDPKKIHEYFSHKKSLLAKKNIEKNSGTSSSWILPNGTIYDSKQKEGVHKVEGREHFYICIKNNLKLGNKFIKAMNKGMVSKSYCGAGIKFFKNSDSIECVELKINGGDRAWSSNMMVNPEGDYLIIIDGYGNHTAAQKAAKAGMKIIAVPSYSSPVVTVVDDSDTNGDEDYHYTTSSSTINDHSEKHHEDDLDLLGGAESM